MVAQASRTLAGQATVHAPQVRAVAAVPGLLTAGADVAAFRGQPAHEGGCWSPTWRTGLWLLLLAAVTRASAREGKKKQAALLSALYMTCVTLGHTLPKRLLETCACPLLPPGLSLDRSEPQTF